MTQCAITRTQGWFAVARPNPSKKDFSTQLGVHMEEVAEMLKALKGNSHGAEVLLELAIDHIENLADKLKEDENLVEVDDPVEMLDGLIDQQVTSTGVGYCLGYDMPAALREVNASNYSKFDDEGKPIYNENKKIMKGPNYFKADLAQYLPVE